MPTWLNILIRQKLSHQNIYSQALECALIVRIICQLNSNALKGVVHCCHLSVASGHCNSLDGWLKHPPAKNCLDLPAAGSFSYSANNIGIFSVNINSHTDKLYAFIECFFFLCCLCEWLKTSWKGGIWFYSHFWIQEPKALLSLQINRKHIL